MSRAAPTPGPWRAHAGLVIADAPVPRVVAQTYSPESLARWPDDPAERDANTRLIAAAPDMAAALRDACGRAITGEAPAGWALVPIDAIAAMRDALALIE